MFNKVERTVQMLPSPENALRRPEDINMSTTTSTTTQIPLPPTSAAASTQSHFPLATSTSRMFNRVQRQVQRLALSPESSKSSLTMSPILSSSSSFQLVMERVERNPLTLTDEDIDQAHQLQGRMRVFSTSSHASTRSAASEEDDDEFGFVPDRILNPDTADSDELIKKRTTPMFQRVQRKPVLLNVDAALFEGQEVLLDGTTTNTSNFSSPPLSPVRMFAKVTRNQVMLRLNLLDDESESGTDDEKLLGGGDGYE